MSTCEHGKRTQYCKDCGGGSICQHDKRKSRCKECDGSGICEHNRQKTHCRECGGSAFCEHGKQKQRCRECSGTEICEHNREKSHCKQCGGSQICQHNKERRDCKDCGGVGVCEHGKRKRLCKECGGSQICEHNRQRNTCKDCGGTQICEHGLRRSQCKQCKGSSICEHGNYKRRCKECGGKDICKHGKYKIKCKECGGSALCKAPHCEKVPKNKKYNGYCLNCCLHYRPDIKVVRNYKTKEKATTDHIHSKFPNVTWLTDHRIPDGCSKRRPDTMVDLGDQVIVIEIDENQHEDYECSCENRRLMELSQDVGHRPMVFIRFNPDEFIDETKVKQHSCWVSGRDGILRIRTESVWNQRLKVLCDTIQYWMDNRTDKTLEVIQLFYDRS